MGLQFSILLASFLLVNLNLNSSNNIEEVYKPIRIKNKDYNGRLLTIYNCADYIDEALIEIYEKLRPGEPATLDSAKNQLIVRFFDKFRYDLGKVGRYKFNKKLNVLDRLVNNKIAQDIKVDGKVLVKKDAYKMN